MFLQRRTLVIISLLFLVASFLIKQDIYAQEEAYEHMSKGIKITGNTLGDQALIDDVVAYLEALFGVVKPERIDVKFIRWSIVNKQWLEQWLVYDANNSPKEYTVTFTLTPEIGGTDFTIKNGGEIDPQGTQKIIIDTR